MLQQTINTISPGELLAYALRLKNSNYRLVAISSTKVENGIEMSYSFDSGEDFVNLRIIAEPGDEIESISSIYPYSFLYENEIKELFGVNITGINPDYKDKLYRISVKTPFNMKEGDK
ncbi:MAG TPA: NADH-quinone oxidoreductase subunit C [Acetivibrio sp.]|uniref:NADH-quinone oxidoreductase subunit C n=1 Tax=Acetivibrio sp. TaxID=1872092 RepID=UPI002CEFF553|nr:NADH-quinone oxidoreductase subunit C [Acetivibrio sp.]HOM01915.1 NADH-quinone oxidoreductase subunit C [Acetivibrio sp.]